MLQREPQNTVQDQHAVAVIKNNPVVGHVPYNLALLFNTQGRRQLQKSGAALINIHNYYVLCLLWLYRPQPPRGVMPPRKLKKFKAIFRVFLTHSEANYTVRSWYSSLCCSDTASWPATNESLACPINGAWLGGVARVRCKKWGGHGRP